MKNFFLITLSTLLLISCESDSEESLILDPILPVQNNLLLKEEITGSYKTIYTYDSQRRFNTIVTKDTITENLYRTYDFEYNSDELNTITVKQYTSSGEYSLSGLHVYSFEYLNSNQIVCTDEYENLTSGFTNNSEYIIHLNDYGQIVSGFGSYTYLHDESGNLKKTSYTIGYEEYNYDNKRGFHSNVTTPHWALHNLYYGFENGLVNNRISKMYRYNMDPDNPNTYTDIYEYNDQGFPIKGTHYSISQPPSVTIYKYQTY